MPEPQSRTFRDDLRCDHDHMQDMREQELPTRAGLRSGVYARGMAGGECVWMSQNTSHAVMQQRAEPHDSLDDFPTQPWATRALMEHVLIPQLGITARLKLKGSAVWEPAANRGHMAKPLSEYFGRVVRSDIHDYGEGFEQCDFLIPGIEPKSVKFGGAHWIITNPPFRLAEQFIERARQIKEWRGTAMIVRTAFLEGVGRYERLFALNPPTIVAQFTERVPMVKGRLTATGSTATAYCWLVWMANISPKPMVWIPPCRKKLERSDDYVSCEIPALVSENRVPVEIQTESAHERESSRA
jgi:hypothetical protein